MSNDRPNECNLSTTMMVTSELLHQALNGVSTAIYIKDREQRLLFVNDACCKLLGRSRNQLLNALESEMLPSTMALQLQAQDQAMLQGNAAIAAEPKVIMLHLPNGRCQTVTRRVELAAQGEHILCFLEDAEPNSPPSEQTAILQAPLWQIPQVHTLLSNVPAAIYQLYRQADGTLRFTFISPGASEIFGIAPNTVGTHVDHVLARIHSLDRSTFDQSLACSAETLEFWLWEGRYYQPDGETGWIQTAARPHGLPDGGVVWNGLLMDITDRKQAEAATIEQAVMEQALADNEARFQTITETIPGALIQFRVQEDNYFVDFVSDRIQDIVGLTPNTLMANANALLERIHPMDSQRLQDTIKEAVAHISAWQFEGRIVTPRGRSRWWRIDAMPLPHLQNGVVFCGVILDTTNRKAIEEAYRENERQLRMALNVSGMGVWTWDIATDQMIWKTEPGTLFSTTGVSFCDTFEAYLQNVHVDDRAVVKMAISQALKVGQDYQIEYRLLLSNGDVRWVGERSGIWRDPDGFVLGLMGTVVDITSRKSAITALRDSEERNRTLINNIPGAVYRCQADKTWTLVFMSDAILDITGYPASHSIHKKDWALIHPDDYAQVKQVISQAIAQGQPFAMEYRIFHANGSIRWVEEAGQPVLNETGTVHLLDGVVTDITRRKESENRSRELAHREGLINRISTQIRDSLELMPILQTTAQTVRSQLKTDRVLVYRFREDGSGEVVVEEATSQWRLSLNDLDICCHEMLAQRYETERVSAIDDIYTPELNRCYVRYCENLQIRAELIAPIWLKRRLWGLLIAHECEAARCWNNTEIELLIALSGQVGIAIGQADLYRQATENAARARQKAEDLEATLAELRQTQAKLVQTEKMSSLGQLVAGVAHEINNPVSFIDGNIPYAARYAQGLLQLIEQYQAAYPKPSSAISSLREDIDLDFLTEDFPKLLNSMRIGAERIKNIVTSLRTFSRTDEADLKIVDIHEGLDSTVMILQHRLKADGDRPLITLARYYGNLPLVECYAGKLNQVFMNLLSNAIDALEEQCHQGHQNQSPTIAITTRFHPPTQIQITIADNGPGISRENRQRIFEPFYTTKPIGKGTGIGLSISYQIVTENHLGTLDCDSEIGRGTAFHITIPTQQS
ncbi:PAS domain-containing protein [Oscillatoria sp. CS-180]|uniref:PAS domain-containing protein n=1 Tax=Oscillatoria sp. CS-180 TaxID=3021720 RepID=UPI002330E95F|nr:PAS domain-containing protein [Oscillatoria sp. CS-180]MDB9527961.1 PAS domain-containing protein [Oscillatoria sp. CS-180]